MRHQCTACGEPEQRLHRPGCDVVVAARMRWGFVRRDECEQVEHEPTIRDAMIARWPEPGETVWWVHVRDMHLERRVFSFGRFKRTATQRAFRYCEFMTPDESECSELLGAVRVAPQDVDSPVREWLSAHEAAHIAAKAA